MAGRVVRFDPALPNVRVLGSRARAHVLLRCRSTAQARQLERFGVAGELLKDGCR